MVSMAEGVFRQDQERIRTMRLLEEMREKEERERALEERRKREEEIRRRREALQREREEAARRVQEEEKERQEKERADMEALLDQQERVVTDALGRRWVRCEICGKAATDDAFFTYGGRGRINLGICRECKDKVPDKVPSKASPEKMRRPGASSGKRAAGESACPLCGRQLVKRNGRFGIFYGCSGYPACRFTKKA
ncbi:MAG: topoisomerase DNA-binding C4 zinc finger domain-containing protein [Lachnospiraceae bacterium]|nr:topoisomerase DNA-binding C4 zinc finger domain-containing protein [Lachnospiraceae bacterium]MBQ3974450.1 topoisomerase DNA-binding C4 zinc finger domain-containing protein [Lachnospiraceae bacterium]MBQ4303171.1 topoisomerase DNA-binding C4 zinc finger domain-containing protein [Lachnospiraceae bacterium]MBQ5359629.1 topoisomerase DNA-binding C4 zinc finger domain-containing protein [Lachnospiraceae bacterium]